MTPRITRMAVRYLKNNAVARGPAGSEHAALKAHINGLAPAQLTAVMRKLMIGICMEAMDHAQFANPGDTDDETA